MKVSIFIAIIVLSGFIAGVVLGLVNLVLVEPFLDTAIGIENRNLFESGEESDTPEFWANHNSYRIWQKGGLILAGGILGMAIGSLFGIVYAYSQKALPGSHIKKSLMLTLIMWSTLYIIPFLKYPANPPTVGDPDTIMLRQTLYIGFMAISGFGALGFYLVYKKINKKALAFVGYAVFVGVMFFIMPQNLDKIAINEELLNGFRSASFVSMSIFWAALGSILGILWEKLRPDTISQRTTQQ